MSEKTFHGSPNVKTNEAKGQASLAKTGNTLDLDLDMKEEEVPGVCRNSDTFTRNQVGERSKTTRSRSRSRSRSSEDVVKRTSCSSKMQENTLKDKSLKREKFSVGDGETENLLRDSEYAADTKTSECVKQDGFLGEASTEKEENSRRVNDDTEKSSDGASDFLDPSACFPKTYDLSFAGKPVSKMTFSVPEDKNEFQINTEYVGGAGPRTYRFPHEFANRIQHVKKSSEERKLHRTEKDVMSDPLNVCGFCKKTSPEKLKRCQRCMAVSYCDKECQRGDFAKHKLFCRRCDRFDTAGARVWPAVRFYKDLHHDRNYTVLMKDMPTEQQYHCGAWCNLLVEVVGSLYHFCKYSCEVIDISGKSVTMNFHDPRNIYEHPCYRLPRPIPMKMEELIQPGQFLLLMGAHWRHFMDGNFGIRVNDLKSIYLVKMDDFEIPKEYRKRNAREGKAQYCY